MKKIAKYGVMILALLLLYVHFDTSAGLQLPENNRKLRNYNIDFNLVAEEAIPILQALLRTDTTRKNEKKITRYFARILKRNGISSQSYEAARGRANLLAELPAANAGRGLILTSHLDVVEADAREWVVPPFSGVIKGGRIYGRGALDMKSMAVMQLMTMLLLKRNNIPLKHKLMFLALADEESGGELGIQHLIKNHRSVFTGYENVLNEGGLGTRGIAIKDKTIFNIQFAGKGTFWLKVTASGPSGHGSLPPTEYASLKLMKFIQRLSSFQDKMIISEHTEKFFYQMGEASDFPNSYFLKRSGNPLVQRVLKPVIEGNKHLRAMTRNTVSLTSLNSGNSEGPNVITDRAEATLDIRLLPGYSPNEMLLQINQLAEQYGIKVKVINSAASKASRINNHLFNSIARVVQVNEPSAFITPLLSPASTDSLYMRPINLNCYGFMPIVVTAEELAGLHGKNENISIENFKRGLKMMFEVVLAYNELYAN